MSSNKHGRLMIDIESVLLSDEDINVIKNPHVGGIILFERNFKSRDQIKDLCANIREVKKEILDRKSSRSRLLWSNLQR